MSKLDDIKLIRIRTKEQFGLEECRLAYEQCDCDVSKAVEFLHSKDAIEQSYEFNETELENYKKQSNRRADRNEKKALKRIRSGREKEAIQCYRLSSLFAGLFMLLFLCGIVSIPLVALKIFEVGYLIGFFVAAVFIFIVFGMYQARSEQLGTMNEEDYMQEQEAYIEQQKIKAVENAKKEEQRNMKRWMRFLHVMGFLSIGKVIYNGLSEIQRKK